MQRYRDELTIRHLDVDVIALASPANSSRLHESLYRFLTTYASKLSSGHKITYPLFTSAPPTKWHPAASSLHFLRIQCRQRVRQTEEIRPALLLGFQQSSQPIRPTAGLSGNYNGDRLLFFSIRGLPRGRNVFVSPNIVATFACQSFLPNGLCRFKHSRIMVLIFLYELGQLRLIIHRTRVDQLRSPQAGPPPFLHCARQASTNWVL